MSVFNLRRVLVEINSTYSEGGVVINSYEITKNKKVFNNLQSQAVDEEIEEDESGTEDKISGNESNKSLGKDKENNEGRDNNNNNKCRKIK